MADTIIQAKDSDLNFSDDDRIRENKWVRCLSRWPQLDLVIYKKRWVWLERRRECHPGLLATGVLPFSRGNIRKNKLGKKDNEFSCGHKEFQMSIEHLEAFRVQKRSGLVQYIWE